jgi:hypothetical protein
MSEVMFLVLPRTPKREEDIRGIATYLLGLLFEPEDGGSTFLRNVCKLVAKYTMLSPRR